MALRIIVAPQEYKGTLTAEEAASAIAHGVRRAAPDSLIEEIPLADGGPGTVRAVLAGTPGRLQSSVVTGPVGDPVTAEWALLDDGTAVIQMAAAAGLLLVPEEARDPDHATTRGVGELLLAAIDAGCRQIILGLGGSATNDGGAGMAQALGARLTDADGRDLPPGGAALIRLHHIDASALDPRLRDAQITAATDVRNPLCGPEGASIVYGPQKGASPDGARQLDAALAHYARIIERDLGVSVAEIPGAGSAGGLSAGLVAFLGATIEPGIEIVARVLRLRERLAGADLLITGEGRLDGQTGWGKAVSGALGIAREAGVAAVIVPGSLGEGWDEFHALAAVIDPASVEAGQVPATALAAAAERALRRWLDSR
jgi:glycerate kinase